MYKERKKGLIWVLSLFSLMLLSGLFIFKHTENLQANESEASVYSLVKEDWDSWEEYKPVEFRIENPKTEKLTFRLSGISQMTDEDFEMVNAEYKDLITASYNNQNEVVLETVAGTQDFVMQFKIHTTATEVKIEVVNEAGKVVAQLSEVVDSVESQTTDLPIESAAFSAVSTRDIMPLATNPKSVGDWGSFLTAIKDPSVDEINLTNSFSASSTFGGTAAAISHSVAINGNGYTLTMTATNQSIQLSTSAVDQNVSFTNFKFTGTATSGSAGLVVGGSTTTTVYLHDFEMITGNRTSVVSSDDCKTVVTGTGIFNGTNMRQGRGAINSKVLHITNGAKVTGNFSYQFFYTDVENTAVLIDGASTVELENSDYGIISIRNSKSSITIKDSSVVVLETTSNNTGGTGGVLNFYGDDISLNVEDSSYLKVDSQHATAATPAVMLEGIRNHFNVKNNSKIELLTASDSNDLSGNMRFRYSAHSSFNLEGDSTFRVVKADADNRAAGIRMMGQDNSITVKSGSKFFVTNHGDKTAKASRNPGTTTLTNGDSHAAIQYVPNTPVSSATDNALPNSFNVIGAENPGENPESVVKLDAKYGPAIDTRWNINVNAGAGTFFEAIGNTIDRPMFWSSEGTIDFRMDSVMYFDFRNNSTNAAGLIGNQEDPGSAVAAQLMTLSEFESTNSDVSFWLHNTDLDGVASYDFNMVDYKLGWVTTGTGNSGRGRTAQSNFRLIDSPTAAFTSAFGEDTLNKFSRMSANNSTPKITGFRTPTNADQYVYVNVDVMEGFDDEGNRIYRPAKDNEATVVVEITKPGESPITKTGKTISGPTNIYDDANQDGFAKIDVGEFLPAGTTVRVIEAWRGSDNSADKHSTPQDEIDAVPVQTVLDVTPPDTAVVATSSITNATKQLSGTGEAGAKVFVKVDGQWLKKDGNLVTTTVDASGDWTVNLKEYFADSLIGKDVEVYLKDDNTGSVVDPTAAFTEFALPATYTDSPDGVYGNLNVVPADYATTDTSKNGTYHDATGDDRLPPATTPVQIADVLPNVPKVTKDYVSDDASDNKAVKVGDTITYTITVKNDKAASFNTVWKDVEVTDVLPDSLDFDPATADVQMSDINGSTMSPVPASGAGAYVATQTGDQWTIKVPVGDLASQEERKITFKVKVNKRAVTDPVTQITNTATAVGYTPQEVTFVEGPDNDTHPKKTEEDSGSVSTRDEISVFYQDLTVRFVDRDNNELETAVVLDQYYVGQTVDLTLEADVIAAINKVLNKRYVVYQRPDSEGAVEVTDPAKTVEYVFEGTLAIYQSPNVIDFGLENVAGRETVRVESPSYDQDFIIWDNRSTKTDWKLTATLTKQLTRTTGSGTVILDAIRYQTENGNPNSEIILDGTAKPIVIENNGTNNQYNISDDWRSGDAGFKLQVPGASVKGLGEYQAEILWVLGPTP